MLLVSRRIVILFKKCNKYRTFSSAAATVLKDLNSLNQTYPKDDCTNITQKIISYMGQNIHLQPHHPISLVRQRIINYFYQNFLNTKRTPSFSVYDNLPPVVSVEQNYESLLIPQDHPSRAKSGCYYVNKNYLLRAHMTAHQAELLKSGLNNFLMVGDVYRRDAIDRMHYPVFHQLDAVRLQSRDELFINDEKLQIIEGGDVTDYIGSQKKQPCHTVEAVKLMEYELKHCLVGLAQHLFGNNVQYRWVDTYFPFTQPSWELEVFHCEDWIELLGCGIMRQPILTNAGVTDKIGWAFGLGLERIAMCLYKIPDIRLFWSKDSGFLSQFQTDDINKDITFVQFSQYPQCINDISFWLPQNRDYSSNDFYDLVRSIGGDLIEQVSLTDIFTNKNTGKTSHCYRIVYRHMEKTLTQASVNLIHEKIGNGVEIYLGGTVR